MASSIDIECPYANICLNASLQKIDLYVSNVITIIL